MLSDLPVFNQYSMKFAKLISIEYQINPRQHYVIFPIELSDSIILSGSTYTPDDFKSVIA